MTPPISKIAPLIIEQSLSFKDRSIQLTCNGSTKFYLTRRVRNSRASTRAGIKQLWGCSSTRNHIIWGALEVRVGFYYVFLGVLGDLGGSVIIFVILGGMAVRSGLVSIFSTPRRFSSAFYTGRWIVTGMRFGPNARVNFS
jgi:hypothetical protein